MEYTKIHFMNLKVIPKRCEQLESNKKMICTDLSHEVFSPRKKKTCWKIIEKITSRNLYCGTRILMESLTNVTYIDSFVPGLGLLDEMIWDKQSHSLFVLSTILICSVVWYYST